MKCYRVNRLEQVFQYNIYSSTGPNGRDIVADIEGFYTNHTKADNYAFCYNNNLYMGSAICQWYYNEKYYNEILLHENI